MSKTKASKPRNLNQLPSIEELIRETERLRVRLDRYENGPMNIAGVNPHCMTPAHEPPTGVIKVATEIRDLVDRLMSVASRITNLKNELSDAKDAQSTYRLQHQELLRELDRLSAEKTLIS